jgi:quercetin dioxygenase-like cupin family protein
MSEALVAINMEYRRDVMAFQSAMQELVATGQGVAPECQLTHRFIPVDEKYGCAVYAREIVMPKDSIIVGKIHRHVHMLFLLQGIIVVKTEQGLSRLVAPQTLISEAGVKRTLYVEEDAIVTTIHLTEHAGEEWLKEIEDEVIAPSYEELALAESTGMKEIAG